MFRDEELKSRRIDVGEQRQNPWCQGRKKYETSSLDVQFLELDRQQSTNLMK
jgi:hypothetical protein